jgi:soluble lytic murein transglycosylase-like protein
MKTATLFLLILEAGLLTSNAVGFLDSSTYDPVDAGGLQEAVTPQVSQPDPAVPAIETLLKRFEIDPTRRKRVAEAIVCSSSRHNIDPRLVASVMIVESRGNPFAISPSDAVGIMQIHVPTWARTVEQEGINLFKIEDNVEFGVRILKDYIDHYGHDDGIKRYNGWNPGTTESSTAEAYLQKVRKIYRSAGGDAV